MNKFKKFLKTVVAMVSMAPIMALNAVNTMAADVGVDWVDDGAASGGIFSDIVAKAKSLGKDAYTLVIVIGAAGVVICLAIVGLSFVINKNSQKREDSKNWLVNIAIGGAFIFGAVTFAGIIASVGKGFGGTK